MNVTDELHRLLDERGVEYKDRNVFGKHVFHWGKPFHGAMFTDGGEWTELVVENATPAQAVEATLGSDLKAENEKLRELLWELFHCSRQVGCDCCETIYRRNCGVLDRIRELGIEVDV